MSFLNKTIGFMAGFWPDCAPQHCWRRIIADADNVNVHHQFQHINIDDDIVAVGECGMY